ncbi:MAG: UDP-N-acetylmuramoyl-tripeptide--D-alanyl-D-alanine ligase [Muribaculaceae bacterium]|nr:UDP-N-acetylmuramoyl-tripeptide--D-alanyl-D-alanine ligase [Muribaculaceae bacterium]
MTVFQISSAIADILLFIALFFELRRSLMMFQQNSYRPERFRRWIRQAGDSTSLVRLTGVFLLLLTLTKFGASVAGLLLISVFAAYVSIKETKAKYKKPLAVTHRVLRLGGVTAFIVFAACLVATFGAIIFDNAGFDVLYVITICLLAAYCLSNQLVLAAGFCLIPVEKHINRKFYNLASDKLRSSSDLTVIGITGSYGKTSTKHYLYDILNQKFETLMTPGSYNTTLGVVRTVNELLKPYHQIFIAEMGAKQPGDIKEICDLVHPRLGILTSVGPQHLETFHSVENVVKTKFELIDSLPSDGTAVINNDYEAIAKRKTDNCKVIRYGIDDKTSCDITAENIRYHSKGTTFTVRTADGSSFELTTHLMGSHNIGNLTAAIAVALMLGVDKDSICYSVSRIEPIEHRLSRRHLGNGVCILDDAFNSNPHGAQMAVEVLSQMDASRRIVITPGMVELGSEQQRLNTIFGQQIAQKGIDYACIVGQYNREALSDGLKAGGFDENNILYFDTFLDANAWMTGFVRPGDVVLIENDLPDTYK